LRLERLEFERLERLEGERLVRLEGERLERLEGGRLEDVGGVVHVVQVLVIVRVARRWHGRSTTFNGMLDHQEQPKRSTCALSG